MLVQLNLCAKQHAMSQPRHRHSSPRAWPLLRIGLLLIIAQIIALGMQTALQVQKQQSLLLEVTTSRIGIMASQLESTFQRASANGLLLKETRGLESQITRITAEDLEVSDIKVFGLQASDLYFHTGPMITMAPPEHARLLRSGKPVSSLDDDGRLLIGFPLYDDQKQLAGGSWFRVHTPALIEHLTRAPAEGMSRLAITLAMVLLSLPVALFCCMRYGQRWPLRKRLVACALIMGLISSSCLSFQALPGIRDKVAPALDSKAETLADNIAGQIERALQLGIPLEGLRGLEHYFAEELGQHPEVVRLELRLNDGQILQQARTGDVQQGTRPQAAPIHDHEGRRIGELLAWGNTDLITRELGKLGFDLLILFLATVVLLNEAMGAILSSRHLDSASARVPSRLGLGRFAVFLLILSEEMTRAFLPLYIDELAVARGLTDPSAIGLPISAYMASFALLTPFGGRLSERFGVRRIFATGCLLSSAGFAWALLDPDYVAFIIARCLCAAGYAIATMAMQQHFLRSSSEQNRTRTLALFVGAVQTAAICGAPLGGMLAEQFGAAAVFAGAAGMSTLALLFQRLDRQPTRQTVSPAPALLPTLARPAVWVPLLGAALPAKLVLAGFLFYLTPLAFKMEEFGSAATGRAIMCYFILVALINPLASWLADRFGWRSTLILLGGSVIGAGGMAGLLGGVAALMTGIFALGVGTGLSAAALQAQLGQQGPAAIVLLRTLERYGSVCGPMVAGLMLGMAGYPQAMLLMGAIMLAATTGLAIYQFSTHASRKTQCAA